MVEGSVAIVECSGSRSGRFVIRECEAHPAQNSAANAATGISAQNEVLPGKPRRFRPEFTQTESWVLAVLLIA
jgi:hypothetical protein